MAEKRKVEYFLLRYVPSVIREEFVNIGLVMTESEGDGGGFAGMHFTKDWRRTRRLDPQFDIEILESLGRELSERIGDVQQRALVLHQMMDSYSNLIQLSPVKSCFTEEPERELRDLARQLVEMPKIIPWAEKEEQSQDPALETAKRTGRRFIYSGISQAFRSAGVWEMLMKDVPAATYTNAEDDFTFDFGYAVGGAIKIFHAVSLGDPGHETQMFPLRVAKVAPRMAALRQAVPQFTAVVENTYDVDDKAVRAVLAFMQDEAIRVAPLREMAEVAQVARLELKV